MLSVLPEADRLNPDRAGPQACGPLSAPRGTNMNDL